MGIEQALFITVTVVLIVLLICNIVVLILAAVFIKSLQRLADKVETGVDNAGTAFKQWSGRMAPAAVSGIVSSAFRQWRKAKTGGTDK